MKKNIDFEKTERKLYIYCYLDDLDYSVKIPVEFLKDSFKDVKIEKFNISNSIYLTDF